MVQIENGTIAKVRTRLEEEDDDDEKREENEIEDEVSSKRSSALSPVDAFSGTSTKESDDDLLHGTKGERDDNDTEQEDDDARHGFGKEEKRRVGGLDLTTFAYFLKRAGGTRFGVVVCVLGFAAYGLMATGDLWLASWVQDDDQFGRQYSDIQRAMGYVAFSLGQALLVLWLSTWDALSVNEACKAIHADSVEKLLAAPSSFFESTPSGRIMSRFSSDLSLVDHNFADTLDNFIQVSHFACNTLFAPWHTHHDASTGADLSRALDWRRDCLRLRFATPTMSLVYLSSAPHVLLSNPLLFFCAFPVHVHSSSSRRRDCCYRSRDERSLRHRARRVRLVRIRDKSVQSRSEKRDEQRAESASHDLLRCVRKPLPRQ